MRRAVYYGNRDVRIEEAEPEPLGPTDVRVRVEACGICGTDLHEYATGPHFIPTEEPHTLTGESAPVPLGHECSGTVAAVGDAVERHAVGDRVAVHPVLSCGECRYCERGDYHLCPDIGFVGTSGVGGGFATETLVPAANLVPVPDDLALADAALAEPLMAALHSVRRADVSPGDDVAVFGAGPIGLLVQQAARVAGARSTYVVEPRPGRRRVAERLGADAVLDPTAVDVAERLREETAIGVDAAIEASGAEGALRAALAGTQRGGTVCVVSLFEEDASVDPLAVTTGERTLTGSFCAAAGPLAPYGELRTALAVLADGRVDPTPLVTRSVDLDDLVEEGLEPLSRGDTDDVKVLVRP